MRRAAAMFLRTLGASRAHTAGARELHERLQVVASAILAEPAPAATRPAPSRR
jgi:hypothetical protein